MAFQKAVWVVRDRITSRAAIDELLADSVGWNVRDVVVQVHGRGDAYYASELEPRPEALGAEAFDPLAHLVRAAAVVGVRVHLWAKLYLVRSSPERTLPAAAAHLTRAHPEWLLRPDGVRPLDPASGTDVAGIYVDPASAAARARTVDVLADIAARYAVEGLHSDYSRYSAADARSSADHAEVTALVRDAATRLRATRPGIVLSAAVSADPAAARERVLQRWPEWAAAGLVDLVCPIAYRRETAEVARLLAHARAAAPQIRMWGGLLAYAGERDLARAHVRAAREAGCQGAILFAYDPRERDVLDAFAAEAERP